VSAGALFRWGAGTPCGPLELEHPPPCFAPTPATLAALEAIVANSRKLRGVGLDWGSGIGVLAIAAARLASVERVVGLEIEPANVAAARANARRNGVAHKLGFLESDSYAPRDPADAAELERLAGGVAFVLANPPASNDGDGFTFRREVARGAARFLRPGGVLFLSVSRQYGRRRVLDLEREAPGLVHAGLLASSPWVPFDLARPDLLASLELYAREEARGGLAYEFPAATEARLAPDAEPERRPDLWIDARRALAAWRTRGTSPLTRWQVQLFEARPEALTRPD
jgi:SAM-dependent methyltransferase